MANFWRKNYGGFFFLLCFIILFANENETFPFPGREVDGPIPGLPFGSVWSDDGAQVVHEVRNCRQLMENKYAACRLEEKGRECWHPLAG